MAGGQRACGGGCVRGAAERHPPRRHSVRVRRGEAGGQRHQARDEDHGNPARRHSSHNQGTSLCALHSLLPAAHSPPAHSLFAALEYRPLAGEEACRKSLSELGLEFIDLYIMHWPIAGNKGPTVEPPLEQTWRDMERLVDLGLVRAIGVSNFSVKKLRDLLPHATKPISVLQVESHPYWRNDELADFCAANDIHFSAYSALVRARPPCARRLVLTLAPRRARATARGTRLRTRRRKSLSTTRA